MTVFACICSQEYLGYYDVLYNSLKTHAPNAKQILYFIGQDIPNRFDQVVDITDWYKGCNSSYNTLERICSLRARVVLEAFSRVGVTEVVFLGAKVEFFANPFKLVDPLKAIQDPYNAVVTPHILEPLPDDGKWPSNASVSFTGHISTDVVSFRNCPEIIKFLTWQDEVMKNHCKTTSQTYLDQSWLNFLPFFVDDVKILRDPAYNMAYWNYKQRDLNNLVCFQYSGLDLNNPKRISTHQNRYEADGQFLEFLESYAKRVKEYK